MKGKYKIVVQNNRFHYEFEIRRNITIIQGDSATGKTTLINMLRQAENLGDASGVTIVSKAPCRVLEGVNWRLILENSEKNIFFIDEENSFINTEEFASIVRNSDNYFVLITRENLYNLPYSVDEIYGLHSSGKYQNTKKLYQEIYKIYSNLKTTPVIPDLVVVEDSNSGYEFFKYICSRNGKECISAGGKSNLFHILKDCQQEKICVIADGAAIGPEMNRLYEQAQKKTGIYLYLPESFEWLILNSGLILGKDVQDILKAPEKYIDSKDFFSWERFFVKILMEKTKDTYLQYTKSRLNENYLHERNTEKILNSIKGILL